MKEDNDTLENSNRYRSTLEHFLFDSCMYDAVLLPPLLYSHEITTGVGGGAPKSFFFFFIFENISLLGHMGPPILSSFLRL